MHDPLKDCDDRQKTLLLTIYIEEFRKTVPIDVRGIELAVHEAVEREEGS